MLLPKGSFSHCNLIQACYTSTWLQASHQTREVEWCLEESMGESLGNNSSSRVGPRSAAQQLILPDYDVINRSDLGQ